MAVQPECPATPPRRHVARFSRFGHVTPKSARSHRKNLSIDSKYADFLTSPGRLPLFSPRGSKASSRDSVRAVNPFTDASVPYLPTPLTVGTSRKVKQFSEPVKPSLKSKSLTASLQALANDKEYDEVYSAEKASLSSFTHDTPFSIPPLRTPSPCPMEYKEFLSDSEEDIQVVSVNALKNIPRYKMKNPFIEVEPAKQEQPQIQSIDLSTHMELVNHRTGKKIIKKLTEKQQRFKPRKLLFTQDVKPISVDFNIANQFIDNSIGKNFTMDSGSGQSKLGFSIFSDSDTSN